MDKPDNSGHVLSLNILLQRQEDISEENSRNIDFVLGEEEGR